MGVLLWKGVLMSFLAGAKVRAEFHDGKRAVGRVPMTETVVGVVTIINRTAETRTKKKKNKK